MNKLIIIALMVSMCHAEYTITPDGTYVGGDSFEITPDGSYVSGD